MFILVEKNVVAFLVVGFGEWRSNGRPHEVYDFDHSLNLKIYSTGARKSAICGDKSGPSARILAPMYEKNPKFGGKFEISVFGATRVEGHTFFYF